MRSNRIRLILSIITVCLFAIGVLGVWPESLMRTSAAQKSNAKKDSRESVNKAAKKADKLLKKWGITDELGSADAVDEIFSHLSNRKEFSYARDTGKKGAFWCYHYAQQMLSKGHGSCYHYAAAFACMVSRSTGLPVRVCTGKAAIFKNGHWQPHAWTEVRINGGWYIYDANAAAYSNLSGIIFDGLKLTSAGKWYKTSDSETIHM